MLNFLKKLLYCLAAFAGLPFLITIGSLLFINVNKADNAKEIALLESVIHTTYYVVPILILLATIAWYVRDLRKRKSGQEIHGGQVIYYAITSCRYMLAVLIMYYGFSKLMNDQLHLGYYYYGEELGKLSGIQLAWAFFGYSKFYNVLIALTQVFGGLLLLFRRTILLGALFLLPVLFNITLINYNYDIGAKDIITVLLLMDIFLVGICIKPLLAFFVDHTTADGRQVITNYAPPRPHRVVYKILIVVAVLLFAFLPNYTNMRSGEVSPFEGAWESVSVHNYTDTIPEKNKLLTLRMFVDGPTATVKKTYEYADFAMSYNEPRKNSLNLVDTQDSLHRAAIIGQYKLKGDSLFFDGKDGKDSVHWVMKKYSH